MKFFLWIFFFLSQILSAQKNNGVQIPDVIQEQVKDLSDRFAAVLEEECPNHLCSAVGCEPIRFNTLDQKQSSSLPGLDVEDKPATTVQYKLASVRCEFTYESSFDNEQLNSLRQRLLQKVKMVGVNLDLISRKLAPKPEIIEEQKSPRESETQPKTIEEIFWMKFIPFLPWLITSVFVIVMGLFLLWGLKKLGLIQNLSLSSHENLEQKNNLAITKQEPTSLMTLTKLKQLREAMNEDIHVAELAIKPLIEEKNLDELCLILNHFGPEYLQLFKDKPQHREFLLTLADHFHKTKSEDNGTKIWEFLDRMERRVVAAKLRVENISLDEEFAFLATLQVDEFIGILKEVSEAQAVAAVAYAPRSLREQFFAMSDPSFVAKFIEELTKVDKLPDSFVRMTAKKLMEAYENQSGNLKTTKVKRTPLLEEALNALHPSQRKNLISGIVKQNPSFGKEIASHVFIDATLLDLPNNFINEAMLQTSPEAAAAYLESFEEGKALFGKLNSRLAESIHRYSIRLDKDGPRYSNLVAEARDKISSYVKEKHSSGEINLGELNAKYLS